MTLENQEQTAPQPASERGGDLNTREDTTLLIDAAAAARLLAIGQRMLWDLTKRDAVPSVKIGRRRLYRPSELVAWLDAGAPTNPGAASRVRRRRKPC